MKKHLTFMALACVGMMTAATASAQEVIEGTFVEATAANTVAVSDGDAPLDAGWIAGQPGGIYGTGFNHNLLPEEVVTTIGGFTPGDEYNIGMVYTNLSFFSNDNLAAGHTSGALTNVPADHALVVGGALGSAGSATAYDLNIGPQTVNADGELQLFVDDSSASNFAGFFLAYKGITFDKVMSMTLLGDVNLDGTVNFLDINPFIGVLSSGGFQAEADCDESGAVNFLDITVFIAILSDS